MTKSRDLANAATALSAVSATELAFVDGVTSAIQTQLDAKAALAGPTFTGTVTLPSTTAIGTVSSTEIGYVDGVTSAIQTQLDAKIAKTLTTTTGDIIYASGANTPARLGIGSSAQVLTVASGVPSWAAASSGAMTLIGTTTLGTAAADITFSSISSSYQNLKIIFSGRGSSAGNNVDQLLIQVNGDTASNYRTVYMGGFSTVAVTTTGALGRGDLRYIPAGVPANTMIGTSEITFMDYKSTTLKKGIQFVTSGEADSPTVNVGQVAWNSTTAISSIKLYLSSGNLIAGTSASLYGWS